jgi:hypothetical protein
MIGVINRIPGVICEVGTCLVKASHSEDVMVVPWNSDLRNERHAVDIVLCNQHDKQFQVGGLVGTITAYGDEVAGRRA